MDQQFRDAQDRLKAATQASIQNLPQSPHSANPTSTDDEPEGGSEPDLDDTDLEVAWTDQEEEGEDADDGDNHQVATDGDGGVPF